MKNGGNRSEWGSDAFRMLTTLENVFTTNRNFLENPHMNCGILFRLFSLTSSFGWIFYGITEFSSRFYGSQTWISAQNRTWHRSLIIIP